MKIISRIIPSSTKTSSIIFLITILILIHGNSSNDIVTVHIIPHSHVDTDWLMSIDVK